MIAATPWLARIDPELVIWVVVVAFTLISQWARAAKRRPGQPHPPQTTTSGAAPAPPVRRAPRVPLPQGNAQKELEDFLRSLAGMPPQEADMRPEPQPIVVQQAPKLSPAPHVVVRKVKSDVVAPPPPPRKEAPRRQMRVTPMVVHREKVVAGRDETDIAPQPSQYRKMHRQVTATGESNSHPARGMVQARLAALRQALSTDLTNRDALNKAILLREILDPPLALRQSRSPGPAAG